MTKKFSVPVSKIEVTDLGNYFLELKLYIISNGVNRNNSEFLRESFEEAIPTFYNKPILAYFNEEENDVEEHNSKLSLDENLEVFEDFQYNGGEKPVGVIPESAEIKIERYKGKDWITVTGGIIWSNYSKQLSELIKNTRKKKVSAEVEFIDSYMDGTIERVKKFNFLGVTILGEKYTEGIPDAHLAIKDIAMTEEFKTYKQALCFAYKEVNKNDALFSKYGINKMEYSEKDKYGTGKTLKVDKSKETVSNDSWGDIDKTELRNKILEAKNYKALVKDVYLDVQEGWEDAPSDKLKYPVMQIKGNKIVYNAGGLLSAQQYGEKYDKDIADKALDIRKKLELVEPEKEEQMKEFIESAKKQGMSFIGVFADKFCFVEECPIKDIDDTEREEMAKEELAVFAVEKDKCDKEFAKDDCKILKMKSFDEDEEQEEEHDDDEIKIADDDSEKIDKATYAAVCEDLEKEKAEKEDLAKRCEAAEGELKAIKEAEFKAKVEELLADEKDEDLKKECKEKVDKGEFADFEDFAKEYAYKKFLKAEAEKKKDAKFKFSLISEPTKDKNVDPLDMI